jgi:hypothetical protein
MRTHDAAAAAAAAHKPVTLRMWWYYIWTYVTLAHDVFYCTLPYCLQPRTCGNQFPVTSPNTTFTCPDATEYDPNMSRVSPPK